MLFKNKSKVPAANKNEQQFNGLKFNSSEYGKVINVLIGPNRVIPKVIWAGDWTDIVTTTPGARVGKGGPGGNTPGTTNHTFTEAFQFLLGYGSGRINSYWTSSGRIGVVRLSQNFTVPIGGGHIDITDANFVNDFGVGHHKSYSQLTDDFGGSGPVTLSGTYEAPFESGAAPAPGVYEVAQVSAGVMRYTFHSSDAGKSLTIYYHSVQGSIVESAEIVVPHSLTFTVPSPSTFLDTRGITEVSSGAAIANTVSAGVYTFTNSADEGKIVLIQWISKDPTIDASNSAVDFTVEPGEPGQDPWAYLESKHPDAALGYSGLMLWEFPTMFLGSSNAVPQYTAETVHAKYLAGGGKMGANAAEVIKAILTGEEWSVGLDPALIGDWSNAHDFWQANGFFIALNQDTQSTAMDVIGQILEAGQGAMFWAEGQLQLAVYGDTSLAGNGVVYQPDTQPIVELSVDDFIAAGGAEPVKVETGPEEHVYNRVKAEWVNQLVDYRTEVTPEEDPASIQAHGVFEEGQQSWHFIRDIAVVQWALNLRLKRYINIRDSYTFTVPTRYRHLLRPLKLITLTWDRMGWAQKPLRILKIEESHEGLALTLEEFPYGIGSATLYPKLTAQAINANPALISPGDTALAALEIPDAMNNYQGNTIRFYADPVTPNNWGGCQLFFSGDELNWKLLGELTSPVAQGTLGGSGMTTGTGDPDTQTITVEDANSVPLPDGNTFDFANKLSLLAIFGANFEIMAYKDVTLIGPNEYHVQNFHRGLFGTTRHSHAAGDDVIQLGEAFLEFQFPSDQVGNTLFFRAVSFNKLRGRLQDIEDVSSLAVLLSSANPGLFTNALLNVTQNADKVKYVSGGVTVESLKPAEAGAEVTTGKSLTVLTNRHLGNIADDAGSSRNAVSAVDATTKKAIIDFTHAHNNKNLDNIADTGTFEKTTGNEKTGAGRAFTNIASDNSYATIAYHGSAFRRLITTTRSGTHVAPEDDSVFTTVASWVLQIPSGFTSYKASVTVSKTAGTGTWTIQAKLKAGSISSGSVSINNPTTSDTATLTLTGLTGGTQVTVLLQIIITNTDGIHTITGQASCSQVEYQDQDITNLQ
jgi:hypothetical protein